MDNIKNAMIKLLNVKNEHEAVEMFTREHFFNKFKTEISNSNLWYDYDSYEVIDYQTIKVNYSFGYADIEYQESYNILINNLEKQN